MIVQVIGLEDKKNLQLDGVWIEVAEEVEIRTSYEKVYGLGERYHQINHKESKVENVVEEVFCNQGEKSYFPLPFFLLNNGYGFFVDSKSILTFDFKDSITIQGFDVKQDKIYVLQGDYRECIKDFIDLTGAAMCAPKWVFGPWVSAHRWNSQKMVNEVREKIREKKIPVTALVLEQWSDEATFYIFNGAKYKDQEFLRYDDFSFENSPWYDPKGMIDELHGEGIRLVLWQCPVIKKIPFDEPYNERHEREWTMAQQEGLAVRRKEELSAYTIPDGHWFNDSMIPDFTNPKTHNWWFENRKYLMEIGVDGFKTDGGEFIYEEVQNYIGETKKELKNNYALEYVKAYSDFLQQDGVAFSRAGYTSQQQYTLQWAGDQKSTFSELRSIYHAGISASLCGQINWGFDIGGFSGDLPSKDLYRKATQLAVFAPIMQLHSEPVGGQFSAIDPIKEFNNERTPWNVAKEDQEYLEEIVSYYKLRMNLLPYIYSEYRNALEKKTTLLKHMSIDHTGEFPEEQYLFGQLIVAPSLWEEGSSQDSCRKVVLPEGIYYQIFNRKKLENHVHVEKDEVKKLQVFIKEGTALVTQQRELYPEEISNQLRMDQLYFHLFGENGSYEYMDEENRFIVQWKESEVSIIGESRLSLAWEVVI